MRLARAPLEDWLRDYYFTARIDISSSGVNPYSIAELRDILGIDIADLDSVQFRDSRSAGDPGLRVAIAERWGNGDPERVMAANGSSEALFLVMMALLRSGDEVVVPEPAYHSLVSVAEAIGCRLRRWRLRFEEGFQPDVDELASLMSERTRMVVINFPHNPTGASIDIATLRRIAEVVSDTGAFLMCDAVFAELTYNGPPLTDATLLYERAISFGTLSKAYGCPGLRVGWFMGPQEVVEACISIRDYTTLALSPLVELFAIRAVRAADLLLHPKLQQATRNLSMLQDWIAQHKANVECALPAGGVVAFPRLRNVPDVEEFCHSLMRKHGVLLVPGTCFGMPGHVRLGFGGDTDELRDGLSCLAEMLGPL
jgi:capreomycidine synthase